MGVSRFFSALAALLFLALSAWAGAYAYEKARSPETAELRAETVTLSVQLEGLAVRSERQLRLGRGESPAAGDFERLPAGAALTVTADGGGLRADGSVLFLEDSDGYEYLSPEKLAGLTVSGLEALLAAEPEEAGDARLLTQRAWYFAALTDDDGSGPEPGSGLLLFEGFAQPEEARLLYVSGAERGRRALVLRLTAGDRDSLSLRKARAQLILGRYSGLRAPLSALRADGDDGSFVYTATATGYEKRAVDIIYEGEDYALISGDALREGSRVLTE